MAIQIPSPEQVRADVLQSLLAIERARNEQLLILLGEIKGLAHDERITRLIAEVTEVSGAIAADEAEWNSQFSNTSDDQFAEMARRVRAQIQAGKARLMFTETGELDRP